MAALDLDEQGRTELLRTVASGNVVEVHELLVNDECGIQNYQNCALVKEFEGQWTPVYDNYHCNALHLALQGQDINEEMINIIFDHAKKNPHGVAVSVLCSQINDIDESALYLALVGRAYEVAAEMIDMIIFDIERDVAVIDRFHIDSGYNTIMLAIVDEKPDLAAKLVNKYRDFFPSDNWVGKYAPTKTATKLFLTMTSLSDGNDENGDKNSTEHNLISLLAFYAKMSSCSKLRNRYEDIISIWIDSIYPIDLFDQLGPQYKWDSERNVTEVVNARECVLSLLIEHDCVEKLFDVREFKDSFKRMLKRSNKFYTHWLYLLKISSYTAKILQHHCLEFYISPKQSKKIALIFYTNKHENPENNIPEAINEVNQLALALHGRGFTSERFPPEQDGMWRDTEVLTWLRGELEQVKDATAVVVCGMTHGGQGYFEDSYGNFVYISLVLDEVNNVTYEFIPKFFIVEACQITESNSPDTMQHCRKNNLVFFSCIPGEGCYPNGTIPVICDKLWDQNITNLCEIFDEVITALDESDNEKLRKHTPVYLRRLLRKNLHCPILPLNERP